MHTLLASLLLYAITCAQVVDWSTTVYALAHGGYEANPLMRPLFAISPYAALAPKLAIPAILILLYRHTDKDSRGLMLWVFVAYLAISLFPVVWNVIQIAQAGLF